ncbi:MAG: serine/threonine-protein kinase [Myxococcales bacterium]
MPTPPRLGLRVPLPPPGQTTDGERDGLVTGDVLEGRYQVEDRIGEGGVGFVYRAVQLKLNRRVAVKLLQRDMVGDEELRPRFEREAITLAALSHPNVVSIQDYGMVRGQPFLVMELLEGRTLREIIDTEGALDPLRALKLMRQLMQGLTYAHQRGIVHRDLKPANLLVQDLPASEHLKVLDFGLVKLLPGSYLDRGVQLSRVGFTFGTPPYMSPEHATGGYVDARSDLYSVGILLFEMLTGQKPFDGELHEIIRHHLSSPVPRLWERKPELAGRDDLQRLIDRCMAKLREERFETGAELLSELDGVALRASLPPPAVAPAVKAAPAEVDAGLALAEGGEPSMRREIQAITLGYKRLGIAWVYWLRTTVLPWIQSKTERTRESIAQAGRTTGERARESWAKVKPGIAQARERLGQAADGAKQRLRASQRPPAAEGPAEHDSAMAAVPTLEAEAQEQLVPPPPPAFAAPVATSGTQDPTMVDEELATQLAMPAVRNNRSIAEAETLELGAYEKKS